MHNMDEKSLFAKITTDNINENNINYLLDALVNILPKNLGDIGIFIEKNPNILHNIEEILKYAKAYKIVKINILNLQIKLLRVYLHTFQYSKSETVAQSTDEFISKNRDIIDIKEEEIQKLLCNYNLLMGQYWNYKYAKYSTGIPYFHSAAKISQQLKDNDLKFLSLAHLCQAYLNVGQSDKAHNYFYTIDEKLSEYIKNMPFKPFYYFLKARLNKESGQYEQALNYINIALNSWQTKNEMIRVAQYLQKAEILLLLNKFTQAKTFIKKVDALCANNIDEYRTMLARNEKNKAYYYLRQEHLDKAMEHIDKSINLLAYGDSVIEEIKDKNKYLADAYTLKASILQQLKNYTEAEELDKQAERIYKINAKI